MIDAVIFDKDGTLYDFHATFADWAVSVLEHFAPGDMVRQAALADVIRFDQAAHAFHPDSLVIAGTNREVAERVAPILSDRSVSQIEVDLIAASGDAPLAPAVPLGPLLRDLSERGLRLGVMTNDGEAAARAQLGRSGVAEAFGVILGADSGHGGKPDPQPLLAACDMLNVQPRRTAMVGDSTHDLLAGRAAGMRTVAVLTGMAKEHDLAPYADIVLPDIGYLPAWIDSVR